ncbi:hypothetical protein ACHAXA_008287 [Cyclostephanos tholiformis]|uniref:Uncharacterized protein n=1 Tax=Cyclostephanos tholiformis TaxID=382380 RepID=A0ABD3R705_9STRA
MKCNLNIRVQSALAITVFGCDCASLGASFVPFSENNFVMNKFQHLSLNMVEDRDYLSPMRQRKRISSPFAPLPNSTSRHSHYCPSFRHVTIGPHPKGGDVAYTNENILRQLRFYNNIRKVGGSDCIQDIYVRDPNQVGEHIRYWFVGKVARCTGTVSPELAVARQFNLIEEHACRVRPVELGRHFGNLEFFAAPGDTEMLTAQNDPSIRLQKVQRWVVGAKDVALLEVGLNLEIVTNEGVGFYILRTAQGVVPPGLIEG